MDRLSSELRQFGIRSRRRRGLPPHAACVLIGAVVLIPAGLDLDLNNSFNNDTSLTLSDPRPGSDLLSQLGQGSPGASTSVVGPT